MYNLTGGGFVDHVTKSIANMLGDADNMADLLARVLRIGRFDGMEVDTFIEGEAKEDADINSEASEGSKGNVLHGIIPKVVEKEADVQEGEHQEFGWGARTIHNAVSSIFDKLDAALSGVRVRNLAIGKRETWKHGRRKRKREWGSGSGEGKMGIEAKRLCEIPGAHQCFDEGAT